jgi:hypothetical protein
VAGRGHVNRTVSGRKAVTRRGRTLPDRHAVTLGSLGQALVARLKAWNELGKIDRPPDADHLIRENPRILGIPIRVSETLRRWKTEVVGDARDPAMPATLALRFVELLGHGSQRQEEHGGAHETAEPHAQPTLRWNPRLGRSSRKFSIDLA